VIGDLPTYATKDWYDTYEHSCYAELD
jgi:hypothetical protein